jgi:hypothetical protein
MFLVGDAIYRGGFELLEEELPQFHVRNSTNTNPGYTGRLFVQQNPATVKVFFPDNWNQFVSAILYVQKHYNKFGMFNVDISATESAHNVSLIPGIALSREAFYGDERDALSELIHESLHDVGFGPVGLGIFHGHIDPIVPTADSHGQDAFTKFYDFCRIARDGHGKSLWNQLIDQAGPRPVKPPSRRDD